MSRQMREETRQQRETMRRLSESERLAAAAGGPNELDPAVCRAIRDEVRIALEQLRRDPERGDRAVLPPERQDD